MHVNTLIAVFLFLNQSEASNIFLFFFFLPPTRWPHSQSCFFFDRELYYGWLQHLWLQKWTTRNTAKMTWKKKKDKTEIETELSNGAHCEPRERHYHTFCKHEWLKSRKKRLFVTLQLTWLTWACCHFRSIYNLVSILWDTRQFIQRKDIKA